MNLMSRKNTVSVLINVILVHCMSSLVLADELLHTGNGCVCYCYPTQYRQGNLLVEIKGPAFNIVEAYFGDLAYRAEMPNSANLHAGRIILSPGNLGLFALRYENDKKVRFVAWDSASSVFRESTAPQVANLLHGSGTIHVAWKTPTVLRLSRYNGNVENVCLVRWNQGAGEWQYFDEVTQKFKSIP